jgi:hypothetical protein
MGVDVDDLTEEPLADFPEWGLEPAGGFNDLYGYGVTRRDLFKSVPPVPGASLTLRRLWTAKHVTDPHHYISSLL